MSRRLFRFQGVLGEFPESSAVELAERVHCSVPTVYRWINQLQQSGASIAVVEMRVPGEMKSGPAPRRFRLIKAVQL